MTFCLFFKPLRSKDFRANEMFKWQHLVKSKPKIKEQNYFFEKLKTSKYQKYKNMNKKSCYTLLPKLTKENYITQKF